MVSMRSKWPLWFTTSSKQEATRSSWRFNCCGRGAGGGSKCSAPGRR